MNRDAERNGPRGRQPQRPAQRSRPEVSLRLRTPFGESRMFRTMTTFGAPADVTLSELAIELVYPLDEFTAAALRGLVADQMSWNPLPTPPVASTA